VIVLPVVIAQHPPPRAHRRRKDSSRSTRSAAAFAGYEAADGLSKEYALVVPAQEIG
jgi:hypothetical protein